MSRDKKIAGNHWRILEKHVPVPILMEVAPDYVGTQAFTSLLALKKDVMLLKSFDLSVH